MKKFLSVFLCCVMVTVCLCFSSSAAEEKPVLYLNYGNIIVDEFGISGYDVNGRAVCVDNSPGCIITQKNPDVSINKGIEISSANCNIELLNLNIMRFNEYNCALAVQDNSEVTVTLSGVNHLVSGTYRAGLEVGMDSKVTVNGDGTLYAQSSLQAGIGGGNGQSNGTLIIDSGTIFANGGADGYSAGIGGGTNGGGGNITVNGGFVYAQGGLYASGIGGGFMSGGGNITVNGGVVTAIAGAGGAGIGSGYLSMSDTNVVINGGSVKAAAGTGGENIGNGMKPATPFSGVKNSDGNTVSPVNMTVNGFDSIYINGIDTSPITSLHPDDSSLYLYSDSTPKIITAYMQDGSVMFFSFNSSGVEQIYPFAQNSERFCDKLITDSPSSVSVSDGFTVQNQKDLYSGSVRVDSFESVLRGDVNSDGSLNGMDAVICKCAANSMLADALAVKISDADGNGTVNDNDVSVLVQYGLGGN